ncbi:MAG: mechanosensitive ion channel domain-containing protein [Myxococcota bacterium]
MARIRLAAVLCTACIAASALAAGADVAPSAPAAAAPTAAPEQVPEATIAAPDIVSRAEDANALVRRISDQTAEDPTKQRIQAQLPETSKRLRERTERAESLLEASPTFNALNDLDTEWQARARRLMEWRLALTHGAQVVEEDRALLQQEREIWMRTRDAPDGGALPPATSARVSESIEVLTRAEQKLQRQRASILTLQNEVAEEELVVRTIVERVAKERADLGKRLLERDSPPLWSAEAYAPSGDSTFVSGRMRAEVIRKLDLLQEFVSLSLTRLELEGALFALVLGALLAARRRVRASAAAQTDPALAVPTRIVERPISAALVVSIVWTGSLLPRAPGVLAEIESLMLLIPVLRLLPAEFYGDLRPGLIALAALFVVGSVRQLLSALPTVERLLILPETLGMISLLYWLQRPERARRFAGIGRFGAAVGPMLRLGLALCCVALLCNVFGLTLLAQLLMRSVLASIYSAIAIYALVRFASGVVTALLRSSFARKLQLVRDHGETVRRRWLTLQAWVAALGWVVTLLRIMGLDGSVLGGVTSLLGAKLEVGTVSISLGNVVAFFVTLWLTSQISRFLRFVLDEDVLPRIALPRGVPAAISTGVHYMVLAAGSLIAIGAAGVDLSKFGLIAGALGVGIGFGLQNVVNNFVSGLILLFERPVQTGDMIEVGGLQGEVKRIGIRSSTVRTFEGADVIVPNASLISERVVNWTFSDRTRRIDLEVGVGYGSEPDKVIALLVETARANPEVLSLPEPVAFFTGFGESALAFSLRVWCRFEVGVRIKSDLGVALHAALRGAGISIPYPQRDVHLKVAPPGEVS